MQSFSNLRNKEESAMDKNKTIIDVARLAGVSKGTVDRVLHNRGEVSEKSAEKVRNAIKELHYEPNLHASLLAAKKPYIIAALLPTVAKGEFWEKIYTGFVEGGLQVASMNFSTQAFFYDQYDIDSFRSKCADVLESCPDGVVLPPLFKDEARAFTESLAKKKIPYVYVDTKIEEDTSYLAYFGMPMWDSGRLCAALLTCVNRKQDIDKVVVVRIKRDKNGQADPTLKRREGFMEYMKDNFPDCTIDNVFIDPSDPHKIRLELETYFQSQGEIRYVAMFNSRLHLISGFLADNKVEGRIVVGFDNLDQNLDMLREGLATDIIAQHAETQSQRAVVTLSEYILMHKRPAKRDNYMHMDILTAMNLDNY